jgi:hypothetical protein
MALTARELIDCLQAMNEAERRELATVFWELPVDHLRFPNFDDIRIGSDPQHQKQLKEAVRRLSQLDPAVRPFPTEAPRWPTTRSPIRPPRANPTTTAEA